MPTKANVKISNVRHIHICGGKNLYCAHPRHGGLWNSGNGELALIHPHASWTSGIFGGLQFLLKELEGFIVYLGIYHGILI